MPTVLITGGAGYVGSHTAYAFLDAGYGVVVLDDLSTGARENLPARAHFYKGDIADTELLDQVTRDHRIGGVLHLAGSAAVPPSVGDPGKYYRNNSYASLALLEFMLSRGIRHILFASSAAVYGAPKDGKPVSEASLLNPVTPYGWSKLFVERMIRDISAASGLGYGILRYFNAAGADPKGRTGQGPRAVPPLMKIACEAAAGKRAGLQIYGSDYPTSDGTCVRDFVHVSDLADAHVAAYEFLRRSGRNACFNCGTGTGYSVQEVIQAVERAHGRLLGASVTGRRFGDPPVLVADASAIRASLGWRPRYGIDDMAVTTLAWEKRESRRDLLRVS